MRLLVRILKAMFVIIGLVVTYSPLIAEAKGVSIWGLSWAYYAMIGVTILVISIGVIIYGLYSENKGFRSEAYRLKKEKTELDIQKLKIELAPIKPFEYVDKLTGHKIAIQVSPYYSKLSVDDRVYFFNVETGELDGTPISMGGKGS